MKHLASLVILASFALTLAGCSRHSSDPVASSQDSNPGVTQVSAGTQSPHEQQSADDKDTILPGRHLSEHQAVEIASKELPQNSALKCDFKDGVWEILEVQKDVWGVSSRTTNADGRITVESTNATRVVLKVRDADGKVEQVKQS